MSVNSELAALNSVGNMSLGNLSNAGTETGCEGDAHGVDYSTDAINRLGSIDASSDGTSARCFGINETINESAGHPDFSGRIGSIDAGSDAPTTRFANK
mgnify:CR=1 FL=1